MIEYARLPGLDCDDNFIKTQRVELILLALSYVTASHLRLPPVAPSHSRPWTPRLLLFLCGSISEKRPLVESNILGARATPNLES